MRFLKSFPATNPLSYQYVNSIVQDANGFMWFGTQDGLYRFDGHDFKHYHHQIANSQSLAADTISSLLISQQGHIWIATRGGGISILDQSTELFTTLSTSSKTPPLTHDNVNVLLEDSRGNVWAGTEFGLNHITKEQNTYSITQHVQQLGNPKSLATNIVTSIMETDSHEIWIGTSGGGISIFDLDGQFIRQFTPNQENSDKHNISLISSLLEDHQKNIWIGTVENGLFKLDTTSNVITQFKYNSRQKHQFTSDNIEEIFEDSNHRLWIATDKGFLVKSSTHGPFRAYNQSTSPYSLNNDFVLTFFEDNEKMIWIGTYSGVNRWDPLMTTFKQYNALRYPQLTEDITTGFAQDSKERIIFSTYSSGIFQLSLVDNTITLLPNTEFFKDMRIMTLFSDSNYLWIGTRTKGAYKLNLANGDITTYRHNVDNPNTISANSVTDIFKDNYGFIWIATFHHGLNRLNNDKSITRFIKDDVISNSGPSSNHILQIEADRTGNLWLATYGGGINRFNYATETFTHLTHQPDNQNSISSDLSWVLFFDDRDNLWIGTQSSGVNLLTAENIKLERFEFTHLGVKDGLKSRTIYGISQDRHGKMWFSSNKGISSFNTSSKVIQHFDASHGLEDLEYNHASVFISRNKTLYFGSAKGFVSIDPSELTPTKTPPRVKLIDVLSLNESISKDYSISELTSVDFSYSDRLISFKYVGLNYIDPSSTRYKYRLLGFDKEWIDAGSSRRATYTNLPQGDYQFEVIANTQNNVWSAPSIQLKVHVKPAPWFTWWAYLLYALLTALLLIGYTRFINKKVYIEQQQKLELAQQVKEKTQEFLEKNVELQQANKQLENVATIDKQTGLFSRTYLDIYIEQSTLLLSQLHKNILPIQRQLLPRLYTLMISLAPEHQSKILEIADLLLYSRNTDDLVVRWSDNAFIIIGYEKDDNARELAQRLTQRLQELLKNEQLPSISFTFYPFDVEQPMSLSWEQIGVLTETANTLVSKSNKLNWLGLYSPVSQPFNYLDILQLDDKSKLTQLIRTKQG